MLGARNVNCVWTCRNLYAFYATGLRAVVLNRAQVTQGNVEFGVRLYAIIQCGHASLVTWQL